jgi:hypothetical protein
MRPPCLVCTAGAPHARCGGHRKKDGQPCGRWPEKGAPVCRQCGGAAPQVKAKAAERREEQRMVAALSTLGEATPVSDPLGSLLRLAGEVQAWLTVTRSRVEDAEHLTAIGAGGEQERVIVRLYERALDRAAKLLEGIARLDIEARLTAIAERDMAAIEATYEAVWAAGRDGASLDEARRRAARHLRAVG